MLALKKKDRGFTSLVILSFFLVGMVLIVLGGWNLVPPACPPPTVVSVGHPPPDPPPTPINRLLPKSYDPQRVIPKFIHMTTPDKKNNLTTRAIENWQQLNPDHTLFVYDDQEMEQFIATEYPEFMPLYQSLYHIVERADVWRYLIIHARGGYYTDLDWVPKVALDRWQGQIESGLKHSFQEPVQVLFGQEGFGNSYPIQVIQWGFGGAAGHPLFYETVRHIQEKFVDELLASKIAGPEYSPVFRTGPEPLTRTVYRHLQRNGAKLSQLNKNTTFRYKEVLIGTMHAFRGTLALHQNNGMLTQNGWKKQDMTPAKSALRTKYWSGEAPPL